MGKLFVLHESFEVSDYLPEERDYIYTDYCESLENIYKNDVLYSSEELFSHRFKYGNLITDLIYKSWPEINSNPLLTGIKNTTHTLLHNLLIKCPNIIDEVISKELFSEVFVDEHMGNCDFKFESTDTLFIYWDESWNNWTINWKREHTVEIITSDISDYFLPNKEFSTKLLKKELTTRTLKNRRTSENPLEILKKEYNDDVGLAFHNEIMKLNSRGDLMGYAFKIGDAILNANFYKFESILTSSESKAFGSLRRIYSLERDHTKQYISIDFEKGMFEYHDYKGIHLGEYRFDGSFNKKAEASHNLKTL